MAYYAGTDKKTGKASLSQTRSFTRGARKMIVSFGISDNPCDKYYHNVAPSNVASSSVAPSSVSKASTESKEQKRARKKAETKQYFEEFYGEKEKVREANKAKRKQEKEETYKKLVADGVISYNTKPKAKPKPYVAPVPTGRKKMRQCADGSIEIYFET